MNRLAFSVLSVGAPAVWRVPGPQMTPPRSDPLCLWYAPAITITFSFHVNIFAARLFDLGM